MSGHASLPPPPPFQHPTAGPQHTNAAPTPAISNTLPPAPPSVFLAPTQMSAPTYHHTSQPPPLPPPNNYPPATATTLPLPPPPSFPPGPTVSNAMHSNRSSLPLPPPPPDQFSMSVHNSSRPLPPVPPNDGYNEFPPVPSHTYGNHHPPAPVPMNSYSNSIAPPQPQNSVPVHSQPPPPVSSAPLSMQEEMALKLRKRSVDTGDHQAQRLHGPVKQSSLTSNIDRSFVLATLPRRRVQHPPTQPKPLRNGSHFPAAPHQTAPAATPQQYPRTSYNSTLPSKPQVHSMHTAAAPPPPAVSSYSQQADSSDDEELSDFAKSLKQARLRKTATNDRSGPKL